MRSPFKFLNAYTASDAENFFGRDDEIKILYQMVFKTNLVLVYGLSGTGKTSLVQCGLANRFDDSEWYPFLIRREENINDSLFKATKEALGDEQTTDIVENIRAINENYFRPVYLIFDQFEELFIIGKKNEQVACIAHIKAIIDANLPCKIILIMREEYIGRLYSYEQTIPSLFDHRFRVEPMGPLKIKDVIAKSFAKFNVALETPEEVSIQMILDNLSNANKEIALPYLQVYLDILYREEYKRTMGDAAPTDTYPLLPLTQDEISSLGKIDDVLIKFLDEQEQVIYSSMKAKDPTFDRNFISEILDLFVTEEGTKKPMAISRDGADFNLAPEVSSRFSNLEDQQIKNILYALEGSRLLHIGNDSIELAHDSLAILIEDRRSEEQKVLNQIRKRLKNSFEEYKNSGACLSRKQLESYSEFLPTLTLSPEILDFIKISEADIEAKEQLEVDRQRKELEADQDKKKAVLIRQKLNAEKKAKRRLGIGATIIGLLLPVIAFMWYTANERGQEIEVQKLTVDSLLRDATTDNLALSKVNSELNFVKSILDTINQTGVSGDSLYLLVSQAVSSIDALKEDKVLEDVKQNESHVVRAFTTAKRGGSVKKQTFNKGDVVYIYSYLKIPRTGDNITMVWKDANGKEYHRNSAKMGFNWEDSGGEFWHAKGQLRVSGTYTIEFINQKKQLIHELKFKVN